MKKCTICGKLMKEQSGKTPEGMLYNYYKCTKCGEEILDMQQLHAIASKYRAMKNYHVKLSTWGLSLGMRIPKAIAKRYNLKKNVDVVIIPEEQGIKIIPV